MKVIFVANTDWYLYNFRLPLILAVRSLGVDVVLVSPDGPYVVKFAEQGLRWLPLPMVRRSLNPMREAAAICSLTEIYRRERPALVHHFTLKCVIYGSLAAAFAGIEPRVNAVAGLGHVFYSTTRSARLLRPLLMLLLRVALGGRRSRLIVQNQDDLEFLVTERIIARSATYLIRGSGVDVDLFRPSIRSRDQPTRVLLATRLLWSKGLRVFHDAAKAVHAAHPNIEFWLAGDVDPGNPDSACPRDIEQWRRDGALRVLGHVDDMPGLLSQIDIVTLPTTYGEGVPRILLEAAAAGLPIIASDSAGCREIVNHRRNGLLIPPNDHQALAAAVMELASDPAMRQRMGEIGRERAVSEFDERSVIERTIAVYRTVAGCLCDTGLMS
jgi:glycosyltransferase involved in cell wall biosynthesis